jgi:hypothetical protein
MKRILFFLLCSTAVVSAQAQDRAEWLSEKRSQGFPIAEASEAPGIEPGRITLNRAEIDSLLVSPSAHAKSLPSLEKYTGSRAGSLAFRRISLFAKGARTQVLTDRGTLIQQPSRRDFYVATNASTGIGLAVERDSGEVRGFVVKNKNKLEIKGNLLVGLNMTEIADSGPASCGTEFSEHSIDSDPGSIVAPLSSQSSALPGETISYEAVVAVDTDNEWMQGFDNDPAEASLWIEDAFLAMNVFFERDLELRLLIGDVILRTAIDPYVVTGGNRSDQLDEFGAHWKDNHSDVYRQFATLLSGRDISSWGFSGIAWLDQYCDYGRSWGDRTPGSFSYNAIGPQRSAAGTAIYIGHELGHNLGSPHTHCYSPPVDECYNGEGGCFSGNQSCPSNGAGTIMSYCHIAGCGTNRQEFHPSVQSLIESNLASELIAGCILPHDDSLGPIVSTTPGDGATLDFGSVGLGQTSASQNIHFENLGDDTLQYDCSVSGTDASSFSVVHCTDAIPAGESRDVSVSCAPSDIGPLAADLTFATNDPDMPLLAFGLACQGVPVVLDELIFDSGFEN